nr:unnamed protein product [Callosobruchus chinensis]
MDAHKSRQNHPRQRPRLQRTKSTPVRKSSWDHGPSLMKKPKQLFQTNQQNKKSDGAKHQHKCRSKEKTLEIDQRLEEPATKEEWTTNEDDVNMYEDLPVDIRELLDSPEPQDNTVEIMNVMNVKDNGNRSFIPYGTNIMSSIWSTDRATATLDNIFNSALDADDHETALNFQFSSISIDNNNDGGGDADWSARWRRDDFEDVENEINSFFERESRHAGLFGGDQRWSDDQFQSLPLQRAGGWEGGVVGEERRGVEDERLSRQVAVSLMKINHSKEKSCFKEIPPKGQKAFKDDAIFNPYIQPNLSMFSFSMKSNLPQDDLLTSERSHFKPIVERLEHCTQGQYADGATFLISNSLDKVDYKRSESGAMVLEMELGQSKKYREYKPEELDSAQELEFILKFSICQNDKACQTEDVKIGCCDGEAVDMQIDHCNSNNASPTSSLASCEEQACGCPSDTCTCGEERSVRPDSALSEVVWKYELPKEGCSQCGSSSNNNNATWTSWSGREEGVGWNSKRLRNIWDGEEICQTCLNRTADANVDVTGTAASSKKKVSEPAPLPPPPNSRLREDISQDGEQLLSDLRHLQKAYMEEMPQAVEDMLAENEKKMHGSAYLGGGYGCFGNTGGLWSFASRLEEDCLIQMSTLPTLRSVTL